MATNLVAPRRRPRCSLRRLLVLAALVTVVTLDARTQAPDLPLFSTAVEVVELYVSVRDPQGEPIHGLRREDFSVLEDGQPQTISTFVEGEFPLSVVVAIDRSWSMRGRPLGLARAGARQLLAELRPGDQAAVISISGEVETVAPLSTDRGRASAALDQLDPWSTTALYDAIRESLRQIEHGSGRRALVVLSDGVDRYSTSTAADVLDAVRGSGVMVFPVCIGPRVPPALVETAAISGGLSFAVRNADEMTRVAGLIGRDLRNQYLVGYSPGRPFTAARGVWRHIEVKVSRDDAVVRTRDGYYPMPAR